MNRLRGDLLLKTESCRCRARHRCLQSRYRCLGASGNAHLPTSRLPRARQALSVDRPPRRSPRRPRARARRLCADARDAGTLRGAGAAGGARANRRGQGQGGTAAAAERICRWLMVTRSLLRAATARRKRRKRSPEPASRLRRQGRAGAIVGGLRLMGRQLHARRLAIDARARSGLPRRRRGQTRFARGRRSPSAPPG